jgi:hypothetical protein
MSEKRVTDAEALEVMETAKKNKTNIADTFVPRTILYAVSTEYKPGVPTTEILTFVRQGEFCNAAQWEHALELEKEFSGLNRKYHDELKAQGLPVNIKGSNNPLKAVPLNVR